MHDKGLVAEVDSLLEGSRDGVVSSLCLGNETLVALNTEAVLSEVERLGEGIVSGIMVQV